jgi:ubiquinone/menaquinone biosynthesis C-methylase UbiE
MSTATQTLDKAIRLSATVASPPASLRASEQLQQDHYDEIAADYEAHYSDPCSLEYRRKFIYEPMFAGIDLSGMKVLDAMCGSGQTTEYLLSRGAVVTGLDLSNEVITTFKSRWTNCDAIQRSLLDSGLPDDSFDCVVIVGGLHHIHPHVSAALREINRVLKPGGFLCFMEPHSGSLPDVIRRVWYKHDRFFSSPTS